MSRLGGVQCGRGFFLVNPCLGFYPEVLEAFSGVDKLRLLKPTLIGDTLHAQSEVIDLRDRGDQHVVVTSRLTGHNQRSETVLSCEFSLLIRRQRLTTD